MRWLDWLLVEDGFSPHRICLALDPDVMALSVLGQVMIFTAYVAIPAQLIWAWRRTGKGARIVFTRRAPLLCLFASFIFACGISHGLMTLDYYRAFYRLEAVWMVITGVLSCATATMMPFLMRFRPSGDDLFQVTYHGPLDELAVEIPSVRITVQRGKPFLVGPHLRRQLAVSSADLDIVHLDD